MTTPALARVTDVFEPIVLRRAERVARSYGDAQGEAVRRFARGARDRLVAARELAGGRSQVGAFALLREAAALATTGVIAAREETSAVLAPSAAHARLILLIEGKELPALPAPLVAVADALSNDDPLAADSLPASDLGRAEALVQWLLTLVEERSVAAVRAQRWVRIGALVVGSVLALALTLTFALTAKDLARDARVTASSARPGFDAEAAVDGQRRGESGYESTVETDPWLEVDLGDHVQLESVVVYAREGGRKASLARNLSISDDGSTWHSVARAAASMDERWRVSLDRPWARYVKLSLEGQGALSVGELEVYGR